MSSKDQPDFAVIGGGLVGLACAYGLIKRGRSVRVYDEGDSAFRASRGNFGLIWVQAKGSKLPDYARWTRQSAKLWQGFSQELTADSDVDLQLEQNGGLDFCLTEEELAEQAANLTALRDSLGGDYPFEVLGHNQLRDLVPEVGPKVAGAIFGPEDGHSNPLLLLRGLATAVQRLGGEIFTESGVSRVAPTDQGFQILGREAKVLGEAQKVILAAGLGNATLAEPLGLTAPVKPIKGQVLITEKLKPFLKLPSVQIRQVGEGGIQIGDSQEDVGFDDSTSPEVVARIAKRATRIFPLLAGVRVVRAWGALRVMSPDGHPIYQESESCPGAFLVTCHSGVTLAAAHALELAPWLDGAGAKVPYLESFSAKRFSS